MTTKQAQALAPTPMDALLLKGWTRDQLTATKLEAMSSALLRQADRYVLKGRSQQARHCIILANNYMAIAKAQS